MKNSLENSILIASPWLKPNIASIGDLRRIQEISSGLLNLPLISDAGFECRLGGGGGSTDFLVCLKPPNKDRELWNEKLKEIQYFSCGVQIWDNINNFVDSWSSEESMLHSNVENTWLEFDVDDSDKKVPVPSLFFAPIGIKGEHQDNTGHSNASKCYDWIFDNALELLMGKPLKSSIKKRLTKCFQQLPTNGKVFQMGVMLPRQSESESVRICVSGIETREIPNYLKSIECLKSMEEIKSIVDSIANFVDYSAINISVSDYVHPKIGIECYIDDYSKNSPRWQLFLEFLTQRRLCTTEEVEALTEWIGHTEEKSCEGAWPNTIELGAAFLYPTFRSTIIRALHHIKIVYEPNKPLTAKAYLWFAHRWLATDGTLRT